MEVLTAIQTADAVQGLLGGVEKLVRKILKARRDVKNLPGDIEELLKEVEALKPVIDSINVESGSSDVHQSLKTCLEKLEAALGRASDQLKGFQNTQEQDKSSTFSKVAKATVNRGDGKRQKEIKTTRDTIKGLREELDKALTASTHMTVKIIASTGESTYTIVENIASTGESTRTIVEKIASTGESTRTIVESIVLSNKTVEAFLQKTSVSPSASVVAPPEIVAKLDRCARAGIQDESYKAYFMIWNDEVKGYRLPEQENHRRETGDQDDEGVEIERGAREGGWEVKNDTKIQFIIGPVPPKCFFYVLSYTKPLTIPTHPELFFPRLSHHKNQNLGTSNRRFPNTAKYKTDPLSCKVVQSLESLKNGIEGQELFYLIFSAEPLVQLDMLKEADTDHFIEKLLSLKDPGDRGGLLLHVKRFLFDVK